MRERPKQLYSTNWSATLVLPLPVVPLIMTPRWLAPVSNGPLEDMTDGVEAGSK